VPKIHRLSFFQGNSPRQSLSIEGGLAIPHRPSGRVRSLWKVSLWAIWASMPRMARFIFARRHVLLVWTLTVMEMFAELAAVCLG